METSQSLSNKNLTGSKVQLRQTNLNRKLSVAVITTVLLTSMFTGSAVYFWQKSASEKSINNLEQKIASLEEQISGTKCKESPTQPILSPTVDPTTHWKTYKNEKNSFEFKYPPDWQVEENVNYIGPSHPNYTFFFKKKVEFMPGISFFTVPKTTPESWFSTNPDYEMFATTEEVMLDNTKATEVSGIPGPLEQKWLFVDKNDATIIFHVAKLNDELAVFDQILATFRFTN